MFYGAFGNVCFPKKKLKTICASRISPLGLSL